MEQGWLKGYEDNSLKLDSNLTRAEAVSLINSVLDRVADEKFISTKDFFRYKRPLGISGDLRICQYPRIC